MPPKVAPGRPLFIEKLTVPAGVVTVPELPGPSTTVAVHVDVFDAVPIVTIEGLHDTVVVVGLIFTVTMRVALVLVACAVSVVAGEYAPVTLTGLDNVAENVVLQLAVPAGFAP